MILILLPSEGTAMPPSLGCMDCLFKRRVGDSRSVSGILAVC